MNLELLNPGHQFEVPARLDCELLPPEYQNENLIPPTPTSMSFNSRGHYLASSYSDGRVLIFDFNTRLGSEAEEAGQGAVPAMTLNAHEADVVAVGWTRRARGLLTADRDGAIRLWDLSVVSNQSEAAFPGTMPDIPQSSWNDYSNDHPSNSNGFSNTQRTPQAAATTPTRCVAEVKCSEECVFAMLHPRDNADVLCSSPQIQNTSSARAGVTSGTGTDIAPTAVRCVVLLKSGRLLLADLLSGTTQILVDSSTAPASLDAVDSLAASVNDCSSVSKSNDGTNQQRSNRKMHLDGGVTATTFDTKGSWLFAGTSKGSLYAAKILVNDRSTSCFTNANSIYSGPQICKALDDESRVYPAVNTESILHTGASYEARLSQHGNQSELGSPSAASHVRWVRVAAHSPSALHELKCSKDGRFLVANYGDKTLRLFDTPALIDAAIKQAMACAIDTSASPINCVDTTGSAAENSIGVDSNVSDSKKDKEVLVRPRLSLRDLVESRAWVTCGFSHDGERIVGGTLEKSSYHLFHWVMCQAASIFKICSIQLTKCHPFPHVYTVSTMPSHHVNLPDYLIIYYKRQSTQRLFPLNPCVRL